MESSIADGLRAEAAKFCSLLDGSPMARTSAAAFFRRYYSMGQVDADPELNGKIIDGLMKLMSSQYDKNRKMCTVGRLDAAWALTNLVCQSSNLCHLVVEKDGPMLLTDVAAKEPFGSELKMQCLWALGNIAADCSHCKRATRDTNIILLLGHSMYDEEFSNKEAAKNLLWCSLNVVRGGITNAPLEAVGMMVNTCAMIIHEKKDSLVHLDYVKDAIWIIAQLADDMNNGHGHIELISGIEILLDDLMNILMSGTAHPQLQNGSLRVLGNIATGNTEQTDAITQLPYFYEMLVKFFGSGGGSLSHEVAWLTSNIAAGSDEQLSILFTDNRLYDRILNRLKTGENRLKKECAWTIINMLAGAPEPRHDWLISTGVISAFETILDLEDIRIVTRALHALFNILVDYPHYAVLIKEDLYLEKIKPWMLLQGPDIPPRLEEIRKIIKKQVDDDEDGEATIVFV